MVAAAAAHMPVGDHFDTRKGLTAINGIVALAESHRSLNQVRCRRPIKSVLSKRHDRAPSDGCLPPVATSVDSPPLPFILTSM